MVIHETTTLLLEFNAASVGKCKGLDLTPWGLSCVVNLSGFSVDLKWPYGSVSVVLGPLSPSQKRSRLLQGSTNEERAGAGAGSSEGRRQPRLLTSLKPRAGGKTQ